MKRPQSPEERAKEVIAPFNHNPTGWGRTTYPIPSRNHSGAAAARRQARKRGRAS